MTPVDPFDLPPEKLQVLKKARRLEGWTLAYLVSSITLLGLTMGSSQAMQTSFYEDLLSTIPAIAFLVCTKIAWRKPNKNFPYGYHGAVSIGYLVAALALVVMGLFLLAEALIKLIAQERTTIGGITLFGETIWAGWPMLFAVAYSAIPSFFFGRAKLKLAPQIHDKILYADATMMKADWMAESATAIGVLGVGLGFWWIDPVAAAIISVDILKDGLVNLRVVVHDLMERRPMQTNRSGPEPLSEELRAHLLKLDWVAEVGVRLREVGHVFFGEVFIIPQDNPSDLPAKIQQAVEDAKSINWRLHDVTITVLAHSREQQ